MIEINATYLRVLCFVEKISMEKGQCIQDTLPTMYGIVIAFLTCLVGYALWVSVVTYVHVCDNNLFFIVMYNVSSLDRF